MGKQNKGVELIGPWQDVMNYQKKIFQKKKNGGGGGGIFITQKNCLRAELFIPRYRKCVLKMFCKL